MISISPATGSTFLLSGQSLVSDLAVSYVAVVLVSATRWHCIHHLTCIVNEAFVFLFSNKNKKMDIRKNAAVVFTYYLHFEAIQNIPARVLASISKMPVQNSNF